MERRPPFLPAVIRLVERRDQRSISRFQCSHAWFVGYAVKGEKKLVVSIVVEGAGTGSAYAVPIARKIFDQYF